MDDNRLRLVQKITIEGLQSNLIINVKSKVVAIEELKSNLIWYAKVQEINT